MDNPPLTINHPAPLFDSGGISRKTSMISPMCGLYSPFSGPVPCLVNMTREAVPGASASIQIRAS